VGFELEMVETMQRISIIGTSGSGKTTLARKISQYLTIPHIELDYLHWEPNWVEVSDDIFQQRVEKSLTGDSWIVDGNYGKVRDYVWRKADTVVWLDYSLPVIMNRVLRRTYERVTKQQEVCNGNRETWKQTFSRDSIILWVLQTYKRRRKEYPALFQQPEYAHLQIVHLRSPQATQDWFRTYAPESRNRVFW
jgi:adenylate kinase family enzyme